MFEIQNTVGSIASLTQAVIDPIDSDQISDHYDLYNLTQIQICVIEPKSRVDDNDIRTDTQENNYHGCWGTRLSQL